jgi:hypothetical protein
VIADATYFTTIGEEKSLHPQTGFADWNQDFPNPVDFYGVLLDGNSILPTDNENFGETNDPYINAEVRSSGARRRRSSARSPSSGRRSTSTWPRRRTWPCSGTRRSRVHLRPDQLRRARLPADLRLGLDLVRLK